MGLVYNPTGPKIRLAYLLFKKAGQKHPEKTNTDIEKQLGQLAGWEKVQNS